MTDGPALEPVLPELAIGPVAIVAAAATALLLAFAAQDGYHRDDSRRTSGECAWPPFSATHGAWRTMRRARGS